MGAPCWSLEEREYFVKVILPMSKYAGGTYSKPEGLGWSDLAIIMQRDLDRDGVSRRRYTSDMLFQHYYQKCSSRSYKRGEGDKMVVPGAVDETNTGSMNPPPRPARRRPAAKKATSSVTYVTKATQTETSIAPETGSDRLLQEHTRYIGPPAVQHGSPITMSDLEVHPASTSSRKRGYQATVEDLNDDKDDFVLKEEYLEVESPASKKPTQGLRTNGNKERMILSDEAISQASQLLGTQSPDPQRYGTANSQGQWAKSSGARSQTPLGRIPRLDSPLSDIRSAGTSSIAYKAHTPTPSFEPPYSPFDTSHSARPNVARATLEEQARPLSRVSNRSVSSRNGFQAAPSSLRETSRYSNEEEFDNREHSRRTRLPGIVRNSHKYGDDSIADEYTRASRRESSHFAAYGEEHHTSPFSRSSYREPYQYGGYRAFSEVPTIPRDSYYGGSTPPRISASRHEASEGHRYAISRPASPFEPAPYQGSRLAEDDLYNDERPLRPSEGQPAGIAVSHEPQNGRNGSPIPMQRSATPSCLPLSTYRIRKRSKQQPSISGKQADRTPQPSEPAEEHANTSTTGGLDTK
ncbi:hypothetical protein L207DRAFT_328098 [Hyaloscypha variabilis F]|uniref:Uncharacterized protein n=1 Tax=Hyaloscypha variabilis (strain UAMH 11265 / GT02V1 / F) TaxID=1149755 RepID=A0A2J6RSN1_HYAVF|nr:hypothetical protein L207DRAFT_328098 [Hyaloscypha variabilis F]